MKLADLNPNVMAIKAAAVLLVLAMTLFGGCRWQAKLDAGEIAEAKAATAKAGENLRIASQALSAFAGKFREIDAANAASIALAQGQRKAALDAAAKAEDDKLVFARTIARLQSEAAKDKQTCSIEEARICGSPLR